MATRHVSICAWQQNRLASSLSVGRQLNDKGASCCAMSEVFASVVSAGIALQKGCTCLFAKLRTGMLPAFSVPVIGRLCFQVVARSVSMDLTATTMKMTCSHPCQSQQQNINSGVTTALDTAYIKKQGRNPRSHTMPSPHTQ